MPSTPSHKTFQRRSTCSRLSYFWRRERQPERQINLEQVAELLRDSHQPSCIGILNPGEDDEMAIVGYKHSKLRTLFYLFGLFLTIGLLRLVMHWWRHWLLYATHKPCSLHEAEKILITEHYQGKHTVYYVKDVITLNRDTVKAMAIEKKKLQKYILLEENSYEPFELSVHFNSGFFKKMESLRFFCCKQLRYIWDEQKQSFVKLMGLDVEVPSIVLHQQKGLSAHEQYTRRLVYGKNLIDIPLKGIMTLLFLEILNPFYVFQVFSVCLWFSYNYYYYAVVILLMSAFGITMSILQTRSNQQALYTTVINSDCANVLRSNGDTDMIETKFLVPGDVLEIPSSGCIMQCDAVLLSGNCILDESMLTGESVPVTKTPLPCKRDLTLDTKEHARHMLFSGTNVIQTRYIGTEKVLAVVVNTGNKTAKGGLIRSILYPPPVDYKFEQDSYKFIKLLGLVAAVGFAYTLVSKILRGVSAVKIAIESLDLITIAVPPALPAAMTVGRMYAQKRLKENNIYCISPRSINVSGSIDCVCFDKTGTLTEDGLDMWGVVPKSSTNYFQIPLRQIDRVPNSHLLYSMVTCHSITLMNGEMKGDPLDLKMFESTGWVLEEANVSDDTKYDLLFPTIVRPPKTDNNAVQTDEFNTAAIVTDNPLEIGIVREFSFTSSLQRMSVITRKLSDNNFTVYCKGSPEMILTLCKPETIPKDYHEKLDVYAQQGYRIISIAYKLLDKKITYAKVQRISRDKIECDLDFLGFVILENRLKKDTTSVIKSLMKANIRTIMVTGDNILTALSVAKDCGMIKKGQSVITVNTRQDILKPGCYELYYNLTSPPNQTVTTIANGKINVQNEQKQYKDKIKTLHHKQESSDDQMLEKQDKLNNGAITNSNSLDSFDTVDTYTHTVSSSVTHNFNDVETGFDGGKVKNRNKNFTIGNNDDEKFNPKVNNRNCSTKWKKIYDNCCNKNNNDNDKNNDYNDELYYYDNDDLDNEYDNLEKHIVPDLPSNNYCFAMTGKTWGILKEYFSPDLIKKFVTRGTVFARMSPDQKQSLIIELQDLGYYVAMCGDGANDCGALKTAHTGISLSEAESSVASPFTSKNPTISCVLNIIKEGRAALVTSFGIFKYMAAYSLVQFASVLILYSIDSNLTDIQYLYIDLFMISIFAFFFGKTKAYDGSLVKQTPLNSLTSLNPIISIVLHLTVAISFQVISWYHLQSQSWFVPFNLTAQESEYDHGCYENFTIFFITCFQYIILAFVFSKGAPYRKSIFTNYGFIICIILNILFSLYLGIYPANYLIKLFGLELPPDIQFRLLLCCYGIIHLFIAIFIEYFIIEVIVFKKLRYRFHNIEKSHRKFLSIENYLRQNPSWPPLSLYTKNINIDEKGSPISYAEIGIEQNLVTSPQFSDKNNSVLNSFFNDNDDDYDEPIYNKPNTNMSPNNPSTTPTTSSSSAYVSPIKEQIQLFNLKEPRNESVLDFEVLLNPLTLKQSSSEPPDKSAPLINSETSLNICKNNYLNNCNGGNTLKNNFLNINMEMSNISEKS